MEYIFYSINDLKKVLRISYCRKNLLILTFNTSSNTGLMVCFLTLVLRFPLLLLSGNRYTLTYLKNDSKGLDISSMNIQSLFHYQFHTEKSESCCSNKLQMMMIVTLKRVHFKCDGWDIFINVTRRYIGIAFCAILEKMPSFNLIDYAIYII